MFLQFCRLPLFPHVAALRTLWNPSTQLGRACFRTKSTKKKSTTMADQSNNIEQLVSMGFSRDLAVEALSATGGDSVHKATDWILTHQSKSSKTSKTLNPFAPDSTKRLQTQNPFALVSSKRPKLSSSSQGQQQQQQQQPLSERMRPRTLDDVVGQDHLLSPTSLLRAAVDSNRLPSVIFWGPPGTGKTSIAKSVINSCKDPSLYRFVCLSAVTSGVKDVRDAVESAKKLKREGNKRTVLFMDEVHRFSKSQQDSFLPVIEDGSILFMGATTENPSFHLITPLLSRCRVLTLNPLESHHVETLLRRAIDDPDRGLPKTVSGSNFEVEDSVVEFLAMSCDGDARVALNALEISATMAVARSFNETKKPAGVIISLEDAKEALQSKHVAYDRAGEQHYNLISALHKSMRGGDANAAIYWLARMLVGGEEPLYIARRLIRFASEDIGLADPLALNQAVACYQACHFLGMPECNVILAQCAAYLALAPKSVAVYQAIEAAQKVVKDSVGQNEGVPLHLRNAPTKLMKELGYGKEYIYPPNDPSSAAAQTYLPPSLQHLKFLDWPHEDCLENDL